MFACFTWELRGFFLRPTAYLLLLTMTLLAGGSFWGLLVLLSSNTAPVLTQGDDPLTQFLGPNVFLVGSVTLLVPLLTMHLVADERRRGTWETLLTAPVTPRAVIAGKFFAAWCLLMACVSPWLYYLLLLRGWNGGVQYIWDAVPWFDSGLVFDLGPVCGGALGLAMIGLTFTAIGLFCSTICRSPVAAAMLSFAAMLLVLTLSFLPRAFELWQFSNETVTWAYAFSCWSHLEQFSRGTINPRVIVGHGTAVAFLLSLTIRASRWHDALT